MTRLWLTIRKLILTNDIRAGLTSWRVCVVSSLLREVSINTKGVTEMSRKIEIFVRLRATGDYEYFRTTTQSKTCKQAKENFLLAYPNFSANAVKCSFKPS